MAHRQTIFCERGGGEGPTLVLLHGLGGNGAVWDGLKPLLAESWRGRWLIPDFRGHGRSFHGAPYSIGAHAGDVAALLPRDEPAILVGHSMGGAVAMALATGMFGVAVRSVVAFSVKVDWTAEDLARVRAVAQTPPKLFASKEEAVDRYLRVSGLKGLIGADSAAAALGVRDQQGGYRLAADPLTNDIGEPDIAAIARAATAPLHLLCGETDPIADPAAMRRLGADVAVLPGLGHNPHVQAPGAFWQAIEPRLSA